MICHIYVLHKRAGGMHIQGVPRVNAKYMHIPCLCGGGLYDGQRRTRIAQVYQLWLTDFISTIQRKTCIFRNFTIDNNRKILNRIHML